MQPRTRTLSAVRRYRAQVRADVFVYQQLSGVMMWIASNANGTVWWPLEHEADYDEDSHLYFVKQTGPRVWQVTERPNEG